MCTGGYPSRGGDSKRLRKASGDRLACIPCAVNGPENRKTVLSVRSMVRLAPFQTWARIIGNFPLQPCGCLMPDGLSHARNAQQAPDFIQAHSVHFPPRAPQFKDLPGLSAHRRIRTYFHSPLGERMARHFHRRPTLGCAAQTAAISRGTVEFIQNPENVLGTGQDAGHKH